MTYGDLHIHPLPEGRFTVGTDKRFVPYADGGAMRPGTLFISVCPFLVRTPHATLLLDAGLGEWASGRGAEFLTEGLARHGVAREDVTHVLLSHLHFDHAGGTVYTAGPERRPTFPNAEYVVQAGEAEGAGYTGPSAEAVEQIVTTLEAAGQLVRVAGHGFLSDEIEFVRTGGHTRDHQVWRLHTAGRVAVFGGDVLPAPNQIGRRFAAKYDYDGAESQRWRTALVDEAVAGGHLLLFYHSTAAPAAFVDGGPRGGVRVEPVGETVS
ncbi:MAG: MBL fold metallo-hydrolase [Rubricoccaceae bacterium]